MFEFILCCLFAVIPAQEWIPANIKEANDEWLIDIPVLTPMEEGTPRPDVTDPKATMEFKLLVIEKLYPTKAWKKLSGDCYVKGYFSRNSQGERFFTLTEGSKLELH